MDYIPIIFLVFIIFFFAIFLSLWFSGVFTTNSKPIGPTGNNQDVKNDIAILMPPSVWSAPNTTSTCSIYNYPITNGTFPYVTNNADVVITLQSIPNSRCYYSNELALGATYQICNADVCLDDLGNTYTKGEKWNYYQICGTSCYTNGSYLSTVILAKGSTQFSQKAVANTSGGSNVTLLNPNLEDSNQYHVIMRYSSSSISKTNATGHMCNIKHYTTGMYLTVTSNTLSYTKTIPTKPLWLMVPSTSLGGIAQSQKLVYIGNIPSNTIKSNPTLLEYYNLVEQYNLLAITYGTNIIMEPALNSVETSFSYSTQIVDLSKYYTMLNATTTDFPYYRWTQVGLNF